MSAARRTLLACLAAAILFLACVGLMVVMAHAKPPQAAQQQGPQGP